MKIFGLCMEFSGLLMEFSSKEMAKKENLTGEERWEKEEKKRKLTVRERERERERIVFIKEKWESEFDSKVVEIIKKEYKMII